MKHLGSLSVSVLSVTKNSHKVILWRGKQASSVKSLPHLWCIPVPFVQLDTMSFCDSEPFNVPNNALDPRSVYILRFLVVHISLFLDLKLSIIIIILILIISCIHFGLFTFLRK